MRPDPGHLGTEGGRLGVAQSNPLVEHVAQRSPAEVFEHQIGAVGVLTPVEDSKDMGVVERGD